ncbi:sigma-70 family RNA polymerase sigma factor [Candidatus Omnitrophota bacterium]
MNFNEVIKTYTPRLKAIAHKLDGKYTMFSDDDLYQESITHLWRLYEEGGLEGHTESYILQNCYFYLRNYIRKTFKSIDARSISLEGTLDEKRSLEEILISDTIEHSAQSDEDKTALLADEVRRRLTAREQEIFLLRLEGLTTREIGARIGASHVMVVKIEKRIRVKCDALRDEFGKKGGSTSSPPFEPS